MDEGHWPDHLHPSAVMTQKAAMTVRFASGRHVASLEVALSQCPAAVMGWLFEHPHQGGLAPTQQRLQANSLRAAYRNQRRQSWRTRVPERR
jgi:hypothetical protein